MIQFMILLCIETPAQILYNIKNGKTLVLFVQRLLRTSPSHSSWSHLGLKNCC